MAEWRPIDGYAGGYEVSSDSQVRSLDRLDAAGRPVRGRILRPARLQNGYLSVALHDGTQRTHYVHALVCAAFHGPRPEGAEIRHLDGDATNNVSSNLAWGTRSENNLDRVAHGTHHFAARISCSRGHEYTPQNTYMRLGARHCRTCRQVRQATYRKQVAA